MDSFGNSICGLIWVVLNLIGVERITTEERINYVGDIHLSYMPYSHSILTSVIIGLIALLAFWAWSHSWKIGIVMGLAVTKNCETINP